MLSDQSAPEVKPLVIGARRTTMTDMWIRMTVRKLLEKKRFGFPGLSLNVAQPALIARRIAQIKEMEAAQTLAKTTTTTLKIARPSSASLTKAAG